MGLHNLSACTLQGKVETLMRARRASKQELTRGVEPESRTLNARTLMVDLRQPLVLMLLLQ